MNRKHLLISLLSITAMAFGFISCSEKVASKPNFITKPAPRTGVVAKIGGVEISEAELLKGAEIDIYEAEMKVYEIKYNRLRALVLEKLMEQDKRKKGLTNDQFLDKYIASSVKIGDKQIGAFIKERKIPAEHINKEFRQRIARFLEVDAKKLAVESWINKKTGKNPVEVYMTKPSRPFFDVVIGDNAPTAGKSDAKVTLVEFSDFQCPFCAKGSKILGEIKKKYGKKVKIVFKNFPLPFHNHAELAAEAGLCANEQGSRFFWKYHDKVFGDQSKLAKDGLVSSAKAIGLDGKKFTACLDSRKFRAQVKQDMEDGKASGVKSTPTFFVNGKMINGAHPVDVFSELIDQELKK
ncbi:MAG: DsbA family protein [Halobacteriovoraceae bacterium]|nr:DsbA family protein [Halobacteriovoraceae bacterium]